VKRSAVPAPWPWFGRPLRSAVAPGVHALGASASVLVTAWQRLIFERWVDVPPPAVQVVSLLAVCAFLVSHLWSAEPARKAASALVLLAGIHQLWMLRLWPWAPRLELEAYRFRVARELSFTWHGIPTTALLALAGVLALSWLSAASVRPRPLALATGGAVLLFGATTILGYATGSPWPFGV